MQMQKGNGGGGRKGWGRQESVQGFWASLEVREAQTPSFAVSVAAQTVGERARSNSCQDSLAVKVPGVMMETLTADTRGGVGLADQDVE